jgi:hypothetical protein
MRKLGEWRLKGTSASPFIKPEAMSLMIMNTKVLWRESDGREVA